MIIDGNNISPFNTREELQVGVLISESTSLIEQAVAATKQGHGELSHDIRLLPFCHSESLDETQQD